MDDARQRIAQVIGEHRYDLSGMPVDHCVCGIHVGRASDGLDHHRAIEIDKALGGLTSEWAAVDDEGRHFGSSPNSREAAQEDADNYDGMTVSHRWVSGWTPEAVN